MILLANMVSDPRHPYVDLDRHLCNMSMDLFDEILKASQDKAFIAVRKLVNELARKAEDAQKGASSNQEQNLNDAAFDLNTDPDLLLDVHEWDFDTSEDFFTMHMEFIGLSDFEQVL